MLRLGTKYQIDILRQDAITRLKEHFPPLLKDFRNTLTGCYNTTIYGTAPYASKAIGDLSFRDAIAVIQMARTFELYSILPPAFYVCAQLGTKESINAYQDADGITWKLSRSDLTRREEGLRKLHKEAIHMVEFAVTARTSPGCMLYNEHHGMPCKDLLAAERENSLKHIHTDYGPLIASTDWLGNLELCDSCQEYFASELKHRRDQVWKGLATTFDLNEVDWPI